VRRAHQFTFSVGDGRTAQQKCRQPEYGLWTKSPTRIYSPYHIKRCGSDASTLSTAMRLCAVPGGRICGARQERGRGELKTYMNFIEEMAKSSQRVDPSHFVEKIPAKCHSKVNAVGGGEKTDLTLPRSRLCNSHQFVGPHFGLPAFPLSAPCRSSSVPCIDVRGFQHGSRGPIALLPLSRVDRTPRLLASLGPHRQSCPNQSYLCHSPRRVSRPRRISMNKNETV
jgi:hypothetical protein